MKNKNYDFEILKEEKIEKKIKCPYCNSYVVHCLDNVYLCEGCNAELKYDFKKNEWKKKAI